MSKKTETAFKERVQDDLDSIGAWHEKIQQVAIRGTPDVLVCFRGVFGAFELKSSQLEKADELQRYKLMKIDQAGGFARVTSPETWADDYLAFIKFCYEKTKPQGGKNGRDDHDRHHE